MEWYQLLSYLFTNGIRIVAGFLLVDKVLKLQTKMKQTAVALTGITIVITAVQVVFQLQLYQLLGVEVVLLLAGLVGYYRAKPRMCTFLLFFYEVGLALWEFLFSAGFAILFKREAFMAFESKEYLAAVWTVRILLGLVAVVLYKKESRIDPFRVITMLAIVAFFAMIAISEQTLLPIDREVTDNWMLMTGILMFAILIYRMSRQYEIEKEVARLQTEQAALIKNDYQNLNQIYTANAKLYHDLHNHMEMMHCYLTQGKVSDALEYLEDLRTPIQEITQTVWTGDEAIDYLINSKLSQMQAKQIETKVNIEFPRNTNIRSAVLTTILGNLLDNAIEAAQKCKEGYRFVYLTVRRINNILIIKVENSFEEQPLMEDGALQSSKEDKQLHGWGLKSARTAAESYDGSLETSFKDNVFCAVSTLFF